MTNLDAIKAKMFPYELPEDTLSFLLEDRELTPSGTYSRETGRVALIQAVIDALYQLLTLVKEKDNGSEIQYDTDAIKDLIKRYEKDLKGDETTKPQNRDMTPIW